jgi:CRISPR-associated protein Cmr4
MFEASSILFLYVETPLHAGSGTGLGAVDLPIQRERVTSYPIVQASGLKGALRSEAGKGEDVNIIFGPEGHEHAGAVSFGDARILLFPVRSLVGVFAWTTSRDALARFLRDTKGTGPNVPPPPNALQDDVALVPPGCDLVPRGENQLVLEEFAFTVQEDEKVEALAQWLANNALPSTSSAPEYQYWRQKLPGSLVILPEDAFRDFTLHATEVVTRVRLKQETKTVEQGALWTEEHLPTDTLLYAAVLASAPRQKSDDLPQTWRGKGAEDILARARELVPGRLQLGGDETVGRGIVRLRWTDGGKDNG